MGGRNVPNGGGFQRFESTRVVDLSICLLTNDLVCEDAPDAHQYTWVILDVHYSVTSQRPRSRSRVAEECAAGLVAPALRRAPD